MAKKKQIPDLTPNEIRLDDIYHDLVNIAKKNKYNIFEVGRIGNKIYADISDKHDNIRKVSFNFENLEDIYNKFADELNSVI